MKKQFKDDLQGSLIFIGIVIVLYLIANAVY